MTASTVADHRGMVGLMFIGFRMLNAPHLRASSVNEIERIKGHDHLLSLGDQIELRTDYLTAVLDQMKSDSSKTRVYVARPDNAPRR
jgi:hypothetical protein